VTRSGPPIRKTIPNCGKPSPAPRRERVVRVIVIAIRVTVPAAR
jgi:hypothetical protein